MQSAIRLSARLASLAAVTMAAAAPGAEAARTGSPLGYALTAVGFRSYFVFDTRPGGSVHGTLRLANLTPGKRTILVRPVDVSTAATSGLQYGNGAPSGEGRWLTMAVRRVRLSGTPAVLMIALALALIAAVGFGVAYTLARHQIARTGNG